jgi:hypothetical protein
VSPDGRRCIAYGGMARGRGTAGTTHVLDLSEKRLAWTLPTATHAEFSPDSRSVIVCGGVEPTVQIHDAETGVKEATFVLPRRHQDVIFHAGGSQLWMAALDGERPSGSWIAPLVSWVRPMRDDQAGVLLGIEWPSRRVLLRVTDLGVRRFHVAGDGSYAVTVHDDGLRCWELPGQGPWVGAVGAPLALLALAAGWRASRRRRPAEEVAP